MKGGILRVEVDAAETARSIDAADLEKKTISHDGDLGIGVPQLPCRRLPVLNFDGIFSVCHEDYLPPPRRFATEILVLRLNADDEGINCWSDAVGLSRDTF